MIQGTRDVNLVGIWHALSVFPVLLVVCAGCQTSDPPPQGTPSKPSVASLVDQLEAHHDAIRDGFAADDVESVHDALHGVTGDIQKLVLAAELDLDASARDQIREAAESMLKLYGELDGASHGGEEVDYDDVAEPLQSSLDTIRGCLPTP